jgi:2-polyprenyl-3-methyl-5-hydroxy-6-metoxy-1,4-benzoquinol methylase
MNRRQRRAQQRLEQRDRIHDSGARAGSTAVAADDLLVEGLALQRQGKLDQAISLYKRLLTLHPGHADACNNLGLIYLAQGKLKEARAQLAEVLVRRPQLLFDFASVGAMLEAVNPTLAQGMQRAAAAWPRRLPARDLLRPSGLRAVAADPLLTEVLTSTTVRRADLERLLTCLRQELLQNSGEDCPAGELPILAFYGALARQCFINEYVFALTPQEQEQAERAEAMLVEALSAGAPIPPLRVLAVAAYAPLHSVANAQALLDRRWPEPVAEVVRQQVREPWEELQLRNSIPRLTGIESAVSQKVREQYEEHPYPRWVHAAAVAGPITLDQHLAEQFPSAAFRPLGKTDGIDILVAGCGTGRHPIELARKYFDARILAVDLSLASLGYAKRKTPASLANKIEYAQADILELAGIGRSFDLIDASGVLHHLADPITGWRTLLSLLRPGGFMRVGLYSELARRRIVAARAFIAEQGYRPTAEDIRRCRQELLDSGRADIVKAGDFFSMSECRDLLFHVQESRMTIPQIKSFIAENGLRFVGFEFAPALLQRYRGIFGADNLMRDLDRWHAFETANPDTFTGMYQFLVQRD